MRTDQPLAFQGSPLLGLLPVTATGALILVTLVQMRKMRRQMGSLTLLGLGAVTLVSLGLIWLIGDMVAIETGTTMIRFGDGALIDPASGEVRQTGVVFWLSGFWLAMLAMLSIVVGAVWTLGKWDRSSPTAPGTVARNQPPTPVSSGFAAPLPVPQGNNKSPPTVASSGDSSAPPMNSNTAANRLLVTVPRSNQIIGVAAMMVFICFFLPWLMVSCQGRPVIAFSGYKLAAGISLPHINVSLPGMSELFVMPLIALASLGLVLLMARARLKIAIGSYGVIALVLIGFVVAGFRLLSGLPGEAGSESSEALGNPEIGIHTQYGLWGTLLGMLVMLGAAVLNLYEHHRLKRRE
ncbi:MAG: hypothetical protein HC837_03015 [Chloroflexaceae bacterium]|nr:hypothetical protein [Chloroflexaceae bacterium]